MAKASHTHGADAWGDSGARFENIICDLKCMTLVVRDGELHISGSLPLENAPDVIGTINKLCKTHSTG